VSKDVLPNRILIHFPEVSLKGRNREDFENQLADNIRHRLRRLGFDWRLKRARGRFYVEIPDGAGDDVRRVADALCEMSGIATVAPAIWLCPKELLLATDEPNFDLLQARLVELARETYQPVQSFAVRVNRVDKRLHVTSQDLEIRLGRAIRDHSDWDQVVLNRPDCTFRVDIYPDGAYLYSEKLTGPSGLPVHTGGRVLSLLSGGIDSPVAAYLMAKRGCTVDLFHMSAAHPGHGELDADVVVQLASHLSRFTLNSRLFIAPYTHFDLALPPATTGYELMLFRRFVTRAAEVLAGQIGAQALVTGDSLGQVASQTIENIVANSSATAMAIFRPLIGQNKQEIITLARAIDTYDISIQPSKDCCALLSKHPKTRSTHTALSRLEREYFPDYAGLVERTLNDGMVLEFDCGERLGRRDRLGTASA